MKTTGKSFSFIGLFFLIGLFISTMVGCDSKIAGCTSKEYVDLGLPSGTQWRACNEDGYYNYNSAVETFSSMLPSKDEYDELREACSWTWKENGYEVVGPNGKSIFFPAAGFINSSGDLCHLGTEGDYWSSTIQYSFAMGYLYFFPERVGSDYTDPNYRFSVRLIQK